MVFGSVLRAGWVPSRATTDKRCQPTVASLSSATANCVSVSEFLYQLSLSDLICQVEAEHGMHTCKRHVIASVTGPRDLLKLRGQCALRHLRSQWREWILVKCLWEVWGEGGLVN